MQSSTTSITIFLIPAILIINSVSWANSASIQNKFLQCLENISESSIPINEAIYTRRNASFLSILHSYARNERYATPSTPKPLVIVAAKHESHVKATVICSKLNSLQIRIRSGGHDYDGLSYVSNVPFVLLDMFNLRSVSINVTEESAWVQSGAILGELYYEIAKASPVHGFPAGICPTIGVGGHFGGGGYGHMMRKYGLAVDNIIDAQVVDVNGRVLDRKSMGEDLFWAIRGGGAASFCVVLSWKIKLVRVPETVTVFRIEKTLEQGAKELVWKWQHVADKLEDDLFIRLMLNPVNNGSQEGNKRTVKATFIAMFLGQSKALLQLMNTSFPELGLQQHDCINMRWVESFLFWYDFPTGTPIETLLKRNVGSDMIYFKRKVDYVQEPISKTGLESIWKVMIENGEVGMIWNPYGGKMGKISDTETPFPHRAGNIFKIQYKVDWKQGGIETAKRFLNLTRILYDAMTPYVSKNPREAFLNYRDVDIGTNSNGTYEEGRVYGIKYFKNNFERLVQVKTAVDPDNFFRYEQSIPTRSH